MELTPALHLVRVPGVAMKSILEGKWRTDFCRLIRKPILAFRAWWEMTVDHLGIVEEQEI